MKKLISLVAVFAIIASCSLCAFATDLNADDVAAARPLTGVDGVYTVEAPSNAAYSTIVAVKGTKIQVGAIQYINQASTAEGTPSFEFMLNPDLLTAAIAAGNTDPMVYVVTGGDGSMTVKGYIDTTAPVDPEPDPDPDPDPDPEPDPDPDPDPDPEPDEPEVPEVKYFTITGTVTGYVGTTLPTVVVTVGEDSYTATVNADKTFTVTVPVLAEGSYTLTATKLSHLSYTKANITAEAEATVTVNPVVKGGDINASGQADVLDIGAVINVFNSKTGDAKYNIANDLNESGQCDVLDIGVIINNFNQKAISE